MFARVFGTGSDQIVAMKMFDDYNNPILRVYFKPKNPLIALSSAELTYDDEATRDKVFDEAEEKHFRALAFG